MIYYLVVILVFSLYIIYDINSISIKNGVLSKFFLLGSLIFLVENTIILSTLLFRINFNLKNILLLFLSLVFFILLIYTLFFSLPFNETYVDEDKTRQVVRTGMYSLSRHIGVLWFIFMYICLIIVFKDHTFTIFALISCLMNLIYIVFQDNYSFLKLFDDYQEYKEEVSFLIPTINSLKKFVTERGKR
jgi:protein-S-isoprenylcysteine O-methyltransferase Ste14